MLIVKRRKEQKKERTGKHESREKVNVENQRSEDGKSLHVAVVKNEVTEMKKILLHSQKELDAQDKLGFTPLHLACAMGNVKAAKLLLLYKADINIKDKKDRTALHVAALEKHSEIVEILLSHGADPSVINFKEMEKSGTSASLKKKDKTTPPALPKLTLLSLTSSRDTLSEKQQSSDKELSDTNDDTLMSGVETGTSKMSSEEPSIDRILPESTLFDSLDQGISPTRPSMEEPDEQSTKYLEDLEREYMGYMRRKNLELLKKKIKRCSGLQKELKRTLDKMALQFLNGSNFDGNRAADLIHAASLADLQTQVDSFKEKNNGLQQQLIAGQKPSISKSKQELLLYNAFSDLLTENFELKKQLQRQNRSEPRSSEL